MTRLLSYLTGHLQDLIRAWLRALVVDDTRLGIRCAFACAVDS